MVVWVRWGDGGGWGGGGGRMSGVEVSVGEWRCDVCERGDANGGRAEINSLT